MQARAGIHTSPMVTLAPCPAAAAGGGVGEMKKAAAEVVGVGLTFSSSIHRRHQRSPKKFPRTAGWEERGCVVVLVLVLVVVVGGISIPITLRNHGKGAMA